MTYPNSPGYAKGSDTSKAAAESLSTHGELSFAVLRAVRNAGSIGIIVDDAKALVEDELGRSFDRSTVAARFTELKAQEMIEETDQRRMTPRDRMATVFKITLKGRNYFINN